MSECNKNDAGGNSEPDNILLSKRAYTNHYQCTQYLLDNLPSFLGLKYPIERLYSECNVFDISNISNIYKVYSRSKHNPFCRLQTHVNSVLK